MLPSDLDATSRYQPRKTSALAYQNSGLHDRSHSRSPRNLLVVIPSPDLPLDQGKLGNVLSTGPHHRLPHGILMPLFSSMYGQLNAIAREYNFPSTVGLCLYLHVNENGIRMTPRISDDSWHYLFGHLFDGRPPSTGQQLPIGGSIEFDIDLNKARWFDAWTSGSLRNSDPILPSGVTSQTSLEAHWRGESQTINVDGQPHEDQWVASRPHTLTNNSQPETLRHLPKKLSLVDRLDLHGIHKSQDHRDCPDSTLTHGTYASSPILQPAIPKVAENDLKHRVNSWRATTELCPASMADTYQPSQDVGTFVGVTTMDEYALERNFQQAVGIDDFLWSVPSVEPRSPVMELRTTSSRPSSLLLDRPANGVVPLSPTTVTSWGPVDNEWHSDILSATRLPSPDTGERIIEDVVIPRSRPVWGHSFGWRSATTWKHVYPFSVIQTMPTIRVQLQDSSGFVPQYPNLVVYPAVDSKSSSQSVWQREVSPIRLPGAGGLQSKYPNIRLYPEVYPHFEIYPAYTTEEDILRPVSMMLSDSNTLMACYPSLVIYPAVYPYLDIYPPVVRNVEKKGSAQVGTNESSRGCVPTLYPNLVIYPAVYPHFDLYPNALQIETPQRVDAVPMNGCPSVPDMSTTHPGVYPCLEVYPTRNTMSQASIVAWGVSFGWLTGKTWLQVYPLHTASSLTTTQSTDDQNKTSPRSGNESSEISVLANKEQVVWGSSFERKTATTWRAVWPTPCSRTSLEESQLARESHYPNLVIYPAVYPHFDLYPAVTRDFVPPGYEKGESNLRCRRIERWRARTTAQVGLSDLLANNHVWEVDEPLRLDSADYAWSPTSAGPDTSPVTPFDTQSIPESVHLDRRIQGSVLRTPSTATTWGPQDDDWYSETSSIERLPSPDLGQRALDDVENVYFLHEPWDMVWPFFRVVSPVKISPNLEQSVFISEYPHLVIYPPAFSQPEYCSTLAFKNQMIELPVNSNAYPAFDIYPAVYPHINIYPDINLPMENPKKIIANVQSLDCGACTKLAADHACYPYNLDYIYPRTNSAESTRTPAKASLGYPWLVIYPLVYPFVIPYPCVSAEISQPFESKQSPVSPPTEQKSVNVKLSVHYPLLDLYSAGYPLSLDSIYPAVTIPIDDCSVAVKPQYPYICIYPPVYPFVQPYPDLVHTPGTLDEGRYESAKAMSELKQNDLESVLYPCFDLDPTPPTPVAHDTDVDHLVTPIHASVFRSLGKQPGRRSKTHLQLHIEVFRDGIVWTPSGYMQELLSMISRNLEDILVPEVQQHHPSPDNLTPTSSRSRSTTAESSGFPLGQSLALTPIPPFRGHSRGVPSQPPPALSETATPQVSSLSRTYSHTRTTSARLSQAVKSMMPRGPRRNSSATPGSPPPNNYKERTKGLHFLPLADRWPRSVSSSPHTNASESSTGTHRSSTAKEGSVLQRAKAFEQLTSETLDETPLA